MTQITIKLVDGTRYEMIPNDNLEMVQKFGVWFIKMKADGVKRFINLQHVIWTKEIEVDG